MTIAIDDKARNAFFSHYASGFTNAYDILRPLYERSPLDRHLAASVDAVSLAYFSFQFGGAEALMIAREKYLDALPLLNKALKSTESAASDSTLLAVLLLDLFEKITNRNPRSTNSWMSHVNGALALVKLRDQEHFQNYTALRLSARLSTNLLISCVAANAPVPSALTKLRSELEPYLNKDDPKWRISGLVIKYANLRGAIKDRCLSNSEILIRITELDLEFVSLTQNMPSPWLYVKTYPEDATERVLEQQYDTYPDHFTTQTWNVLRTMRILLNDLLRAYLIDSDSGTEVTISRQAEVATITIDDLAKQICASAPQYTMSGDFTLESKDYSAAQSLRCYTLLFPLYVAGMYASPETKIKSWVTNQFRFMADEIGIRNVNVVADILERADGTSPWSVYAILGSYAFAA